MCYTISYKYEESFHRVLEVNQVFLAYLVPMASQDTQETQEELVPRDIKALGVSG